MAASARSAASLADVPASRTLSTHPFPGSGGAVSDGVSIAGSTHVRQILDLARMSPTYQRSSQCPLPTAMVDSLAVSVAVGVHSSVSPSRTAATGYGAASPGRW